jgi:YggT family protein
VLLIFVKIILSYFVAPYHPVRETIDRLVEPMLRPIRQLMPDTGPVDFSPMALVFIIWIISAILQFIIRSL